MICRTCQTEKQENDFQKYGDKKQFTRLDCKVCLKKHINSKNYVNRYKEKLREKTKEKKEQIAEFIKLLKEQKENNK